MAAMMGVSSQQSPFRLTSPSSYFWYHHSCAFPSLIVSRSYRPPTRPLHNSCRQEVRALHHVCGQFFNSLQHEERSNSKTVKRGYISDDLVHFRGSPYLIGWGSTKQDWAIKTQSLQKRKENMSSPKDSPREGSSSELKSGPVKVECRSKNKTALCSAVIPTLVEEPVFSFPYIVESKPVSLGIPLEEKQSTTPTSPSTSVNFKQDSTIEDGGVIIEGTKLSSPHLSELNPSPLTEPSEEKHKKENTFKENLPNGKLVSTSHSEDVGKLASRVHQTNLIAKLCDVYEEVFVVDNISSAEQVVKKLTNEYRHLVHACDTEVAKIDVKRETPVDHGEIICFSIYAGPEADFGNGKSCIWVDVLDGGGRDILLAFKSFFEDPSIMKVWHNYSFDCHVLENYGLQVSGFHADTMHMARLWNSSRQSEGGYSLEALTSDPKIMSKAAMNTHEQRFLSKDLMGKLSMKTIFGKKKVKKDGSEGKVISVAPVEELQRMERKPWICYSALDSISTLKLYESLKNMLSEEPWYFDSQIRGRMLDFYVKYWKPFGELLVKMETEGMLVNREHLADIEKVANKEQQIAGHRFRSWASRHCPDAKHMNVGSDAQVRQLFFGGMTNRKDPLQMLPEERTFKVPNVELVIEEGKKSPTKFRNIKLHGIVKDLKTEIYTATGWPSVSGDALKTLAGKVSAEFDFTPDVNDLESDDMDGSALETRDNDILKINGSADNCNRDTSAYGTAYSAFGEGLEGREACHAIAALCQICSIDSLISNFILPLQGYDVSGKTGRIHCSLNINTETGRLSARRPNLQNQPALEKDRYKIRKAFIAEPGNSLIVADYGQLELRILAHLANCTSMLDAFKAGGDFHSRTAMNMYPDICEAVRKREVLLEWHPQPGEEKPPAPLLKDAFASERRRAKMLNFSIAYGKTTVGLARDWKVSLDEAQDTVDRWYSERKEVLDWQQARKRDAIQTHCVRTLLGRYRNFPSTANASRFLKSHIERAAINAPVQGSAADVAMCAMLQISENADLKKLGWRLLLQVHDEVILEGPTESAEIAKAIVVECMSKPFNGKNILKVDLAVDAKCAESWYAAK